MVLLIVGFITTAHKCGAGNVFTYICVAPRRFKHYRPFMSNLYWNKFGAKSALSGFRNVGHPPVHLSSVHFVTIINVEDASHEVSGCFVFVIVYCFSPFSANFLSRTLLQVFLLPFLLFHRLDKRNSVRLCTPARKPVIVLTRFIRI
jgi:hypothetical protein